MVLSGRAGHDGTEHDLAMGEERPDFAHLIGSGF